MDINAARNRSPKKFLMSRRVFPDLKQPPGGGGGALAASNSCLESSSSPFSSIAVNSAGVSPLMTAWTSKKSKVPLSLVSAAVKVTSQ